MRVLDDAISATAAAAGWLVSFPPDSREITTVKVELQELELPSRKLALIGLCNSAILAHTHPRETVKRGVIEDHLTDC